MPAAIHILFAVAIRIPFVGAGLPCPALLTLNATATLAYETSRL